MAFYQDGALMCKIDRSYKLEVRSGENTGTNHVIDFQKVTLRYAADVRQMSQDCSLLCLEMYY